MVIRVLKFAFELTYLTYGSRLACCITRFVFTLDVDFIATNDAADMPVSCSVRHPASGEVVFCVFGNGEGTDPIFQLIVLIRTARNIDDICSTNICVNVRLQTYHRCVIDNISIDESTHGVPNLIGDRSELFHFHIICGNHHQFL